MDISCLFYTDTYTYTDRGTDMFTFIDIDI